MNPTFPSLQWPQEMDAFLKWLGEDVKPEHLLEIGTGPGGTTELLGGVTSGFLVSVDLPSDNPQNAIRDRHLRSLNPTLIQIVGDSHNPATLEKVKRALGNNRPDVLFIDGDHRYEGVKQDFEWYGPLVTPGGYVAFHDINADTSLYRGMGVPRLWNELGGVKREFTVRGQWGGIGVWRV